MKEPTTCLITGCNSGIGKEAALVLASIGYNIIMLARDSKKSELAYQEIKSQCKNGLGSFVSVDMGSFKSIVRAAKQVAERYNQIDVLINNAGVLKRKKEISEDGIEITMAVNYFAPFLLTQKLIPVLTNQHGSRIINVGSEMYRFGKLDLENLCSEGKHKGKAVYANSKLLLILFTQELAARLRSNSCTANCMHPGLIGTGVFREYPTWFSKVLNLFATSLEEGAKPLVKLATSRELDTITGAYFNKMKKTDIKHRHITLENAKTLWDRTEDIINKRLQS